MCRWHWRRFPGGAPTPIHCLATTSSISIIAGSRRWDMTRVANTDFQTHTNTGTNTDVNTDTKTDWYTDQNGWFFWKSFKRSWPQRKPFSSIFRDFASLPPPSLINCCQVQSFAAQMRAGWHGTRLAEQSEHSTLARNTEAQCNGGWSVICARYRDTENTVYREGI